MNLFTVIPGEKAILARKGRFYQVDLYRLGDRLFAKHGGSFIGLQKHENGTTDPDVLWQELSMAYRTDKLGRLMVT